MTSGEPIVLTLTDGQSALVARQTGAATKTLTATTLSFVAMTMAAEAAEAGADLGVRAPLRLELTREQRAQIEAAIGLRVPAILVDPDVWSVSCYEDWTSGVSGFTIGKRFFVTLGESVPSPVTDRTVIRLDGDRTERGAFGTGIHSTTRICLRLLEKWIDGARSVADIGTGSGILAIAALHLGAERVLALDTDEAAIRSARRNLERNHVADRAVLAARELEAESDGPFDLVMANLFPNVLLALVPALAEVVVDGGVLVVSGTVESRIDDVVGALESVGFTELERRSSSDSWSGAALRREP